MNILPYSFELNKEACNEFIRLSDSSVRDICRKIIKNTNHVSYGKFLITLKSIIDEYLENYYNSHHLKNKRPIFLYNYDSDKNKSNYWILNYIIKYLKTKINPKIEIFLVNQNSLEKLKDNDIIIFTDDCIYSGNQLATKIAKFSEYKGKYKYFILVPYGSLQARLHIEEIFNNNELDLSESSEDSDYSQKRKRSYDDDEIIFPEKMEDLILMEDILTTKEIIKITYFYNGNYKLINPENTYLIYFDHKLADKISVPTIFYLGVVPNKKNKEILKNLSPTEIPKHSHNLDIIPIINNCSFYTSNIDLLNPKCPYPPYKEGYDSFVNKMEKLRLNKKYFSSPRILKNYNSINKGKSI